MFCVETLRYRSWVHLSVIRNSNTNVILSNKIQIQNTLDCFWQNYDIGKLYMAADIGISLVF